MYKEYEMFYSIRTNKGATISMTDEPTPESGYMVSMEGMEQQVPMNLFSQNHVAAFVTRNFADLAKPGHFFGAWIADGVAYLDVSVHFDTEAEAVEFGQLNNQLAIWDIAKGEVITL